MGLMIHWSMCPIVTCMLLKGPLAATSCFLTVFFLWCIHFIAFELEMPFGEKDNDLPLDSFQRDWNKSIMTLLSKRAREPPEFVFDKFRHRKLEIVMSDGTRAVNARMTIARKVSESFGEQE